MDKAFYLELQSWWNILERVQRRGKVEGNFSRDIKETLLLNVDMVYKLETDAESRAHVQLFGEFQGYA